MLNYSVLAYSSLDLGNEKNGVDFGEKYISYAYHVVMRLSHFNGSTCDHVDVITIVRIRTQQHDARVSHSPLSAITALCSRQEPCG